VLNGVTFVIFGAVLLGPALADATWQLVLYAVLSLTIVRMIPVAIAMWGTRARRPTVSFLGWFGPRGLASIVFAVIVIEESALPHEALIVQAIYLTVGLSVLAHGITAAPLAGRYARWYERHPRDQRPPMESVPAEVTRPRGPVTGARESPAAVPAADQHPIGTTRGMRSSLDPERTE
jgi:NhaP-type Na+/H+ or K+/H+ antiporter